MSARTEGVKLHFTPDEWAALNAMRLAAGREMSMAIFCRGLILDIVADDAAAHEDTFQPIGDVAKRAVEGLK